MGTRKAKAKKGSPKGRGRPGKSPPRKSARPQGTPIRVRKGGIGPLQEGEQYRRRVSYRDKSGRFSKLDRRKKLRVEVWVDRIFQPKKGKAKRRESVFLGRSALQKVPKARPTEFRDAEYESAFSGQVYVGSRQSMDAFLQGVDFGPNLTWARLEGKDPKGRTVVIQVLPFRSTGDPEKDREILTARIMEQLGKQGYALYGRRVLQNLGIKPTPERMAKATLRKIRITVGTK